MPPHGRAERTRQDAPPRLIAFRRLTVRSATGTPQRGGPCRSKRARKGRVRPSDLAAFLTRSERGEVSAAFPTIFRKARFSKFVFIREIRVKVFVFISNFSSLLAWQIKFPPPSFVKFVSQSLSSFLPAVEGDILQPGPQGRAQFDGERANAASGALDGRLFFNRNVLRDIHRDGLGTVSDAFQGRK